MQSLKAIHDQGTSTGTSSTTGWIQGADNTPGYVASFRTRTQSATKAARSAAAPKKRFNGVAVIVTGVIVAGTLSYIGYSLGTIGGVGKPTLNVAVAVIIGLVTMLIGAVVAMRDSGYNRNVFPDAHARWDRTWRCLRCGTGFVV